MFKRYCNFVVSKNNELSLGINTKKEQEEIAELYLNEVKGYDDFKKGKIYKNDLVLIDIVQKYKSKNYISSENYADADIVDISDINNR